MSETLRVNDPDYQRIRESVLKRDEHRCIDCGYTTEDNGARQIHVHHVIPERLFNEVDPHQPSNLVTLCSMCHGAWEKEFRAMMAGRPAWNSQVRNRIRKHLGDDVAFLEEHFPEVHKMVREEVCDS